ncbi:MULTISPECIES: hypothetical protein [Enterococcus]|uniref:PRC-barrel domain-containing protein n=1 Tax=Enterococcus gallinarum TaxID=1353 RepID=A0ABD4ZTI0_ENTGA|nr:MULTISPECIES: hypothetical protein [Enterococcus]MBF0820838.1 hypothetical protein [Enterococcus faecalis]MBF0726990.1 hypothetical protein [Enterococcus gallinarum]MBF0796130.1 hypothetical protein [Enterococcus gallinarum]MBX8978247.1 hypothetical protein [Enterococcus gallinarum]MCR1944675.1 hypothetical protein [Enterococcus gallinarum]
MIETDYSYSNQLLELYSKDIDDYGSESFSLGYILQDLGSFILFMSISETGTLDSIQIRSKKYLVKIIDNSAYIRMYEFFVSYNKINKSFDNYDLGSIINLEKIKTIDDLLTNNLVLKKSVTVIHSNDESVFTGKINLLDSKKLVLSIIDYESITKTNKKTINIDDLICIDIVSVENFLLDKYIETNHL